jgi:hypothetical protein
LIRSHWSLRNPKRPSAGPCVHAGLERLTGWSITPVCDEQGVRIGPSIDSRTQLHRVSSAVPSAPQGRRSRSGRIACFASLSIVCVTPDSYCIILQSKKVVLQDSGRSLSSATAAIRSRKQNHERLRLRIGTAFGSISTPKRRAPRTRRGRKNGNLLTAAATLNQPATIMHRSAPRSTGQRVRAGYYRPRL